MFVTLKRVFPTLLWRWADRSDALPAWLAGRHFALSVFQFHQKKSLDVLKMLNWLSMTR